MPTFVLDFLWFDVLWTRKKKTGTKPVFFIWWTLVDKVRTFLIDSENALEVERLLKSCA